MVSKLLCDNCNHFKRSVDYPDPYYDGHEDIEPKKTKFFYYCHIFYRQNGTNFYDLMKNSKHKEIFYPDKCPKDCPFELEHLINDKQVIV